MFTSRAEFRLHLRIDNADQRLTPHGRRVGLISASAWNDFVAKRERMKNLRDLLEKMRMTRNQESGVGSQDSAQLPTAIGDTLAQVLKRPDVSIEQLAPILRQLQPSFFQRNGSTGAANAADIRMELRSVETEIKYAGYLQQQERAIERLKKAEQRHIPEWFDYASVSGLSREMQEKLQRVRPRTLAQASRIPGVTPAAISLVNVYIEIQARRYSQASALSR
jgi:tRNA uridine 5-carboxymethylaminomethyl modification enzyme